MSENAPIVTGTLGQAPLSHLLASVADQTKTGTLVLETADGRKSAIVFEHGVVTKVRLSEPEIRLGALLVELGRLDAATAEETYQQAASRHVLHGQVLLEQALLSSDDLARALRSQLVKKLVHLGNLPQETAFGLYQGVDYLKSWPGGKTPVAPLVVLWWLVRNQSTAAALAAVVDRIGSRPLRLHAECDPERFGLDRSEVAMMQMLRAKPQSIETLGSLGLVAPHLVERLVYLLAITRHLDFGTGTRPIGLGLSTRETESLILPRESLRPSPPAMLAVTPPLTPPQAPTAARQPARTQASNAADAGGSAPAEARRQADPDPSLAERRDDLVRRARLCSEQDLYEVLGLEHGASIANVKNTYFQLAKLYHPDRLPRELADLHSEATRLFARMTEAQHVLTDTERRRQYDRQRAADQEEDEAEKVQRVLHAASAFQKAEVLMKKRMLAAAELEAQRALQDDPDQADYLALFAWIQASKPDSEAHLPEVLRMLNEAVLGNPNSEKIRSYRMQILKRVGRVQEAVADCRIIVERNPHNVDAQREIRLWEMRRTHHAQQRGGQGTQLPKTDDKPSPSTGGGLFGKLFKR